VVTREREVRDRAPGDPACSSVIIYDLEGEIFFGSAPELDRCFDGLKQRAMDGGIQFVVLRLKCTRNPTWFFSNVWNIFCAKCRRMAGLCCCVEFGPN
jgi:MFS superfamily sulfate permease-like transporter